jgi:hypothetical protein
MAAEKVLPLHGGLMGRRVPTDPAIGEELVVRAAGAEDLGGPVRDSIVLVEILHDGTARARYVSWIGYADLDEASVAEPGRWELVEPAVPFMRDVTWQPYGWGPLDLVYTHPPPSERHDLRNGRGKLAPEELARI